MTNFFKSIFPIILISIISSSAIAADLSGRVFVKNTDGRVYSVPASINIGDKLTLQIGGKKMTSSFFRNTNPHNGYEILYAIFTNLPNGSDQDALLLRGVVTESGGLNGDFYVKRFVSSPDASTLENTLARIQANQTADLSYESAFTFSPEEAQDASIEHVMVGRSRGRVVYARLIYDAKDPARLVGCWTNAGVGRNAEYYQGDCPIHGAYSWEDSANGRVLTAAGFERGVPYSWTRSGQLDALMVGSERTRAFNEIYLNYSRPNFYGWGFFFIFPWQIIL